MIEEIVVEIVVGILQRIIQPLIVLGVLRGDARMIPSITMRIRHKQLRIRIEATTTEFVGGVRERRVEMSQQSRFDSHRNLPDAEKSKNMINPERVEILTHLSEPCFPPGVAILGHLFPVVGRKTPVLAIGSESVRRCPGLRVKVEQMRKLPGVHTRAADSDRKVALDGHALRVGIFNSLLQLSVKAELDVAVEIRIDLVPATE